MSSSDETLVGLQHHRRALLDEFATTSAALDRVRAIRDGGQDDDEHDPDGSPLSAEWSRLEGNLRATRGRLFDIDRALAELAGGSYGVCIDCGATIPAERLEVLPATRRCVECSRRAD